MDNTWDAAQEELRDFLTYLLVRVEYRYGDNRAPFRFPPEFEQSDGTYRCIIVEDVSDHREKSVYTAATPAALVEIVKTMVVERFGLAAVLESTDPE